MRLLVPHVRQVSDLRTCAAFLLHRATGITTTGAVATKAGLPLTLGVSRPLGLKSPFTPTAEAIG